MRCPSGEKLGWVVVGHAPGDGARLPALDGQKVEIAKDFQHQGVARRRYVQRQPGGPVHRKRDFPFRRQGQVRPLVGLQGHSTVSEAGCQNGRHQNRRHLHGLNLIDSCSSDRILVAPRQARSGWYFSITLRPVGQREFLKRGPQVGHSSAYFSPMADSTCSRRVASVSILAVASTAGRSSL